MGQGTKLTSTGVGKQVETGWQCAVTQILIHKPLGAVAYPQPRYWACHMNLCHEAYERLLELHAQVEAIPPADSNMRLVFDEPLLFHVYGVGTAMVSNAVRSIQHLAQGMEQASGTQLGSVTVTERIREATALLGLSSHIDHAGYHGFCEMVQIRDAVEHPQASNVYQCDPNDWDKVPLAWLLSDRSLTAYVGYRMWVDVVAADWEAWLAVNKSAAVTLTVERGVESEYSVRNPRPKP